MQATVEELKQIPIFASLGISELENFQPNSQVQKYQAGETIMDEGDALPARLYVVLAGTLLVTKTASTGKETILRILSIGEIFAAPALLGNGIAPARVKAESDCQILTVKREALLEAIQHKPEIALQILMVFNQRIQQLHDTVHGLVSERAIVRLARLIQYFAARYGTENIGSNLCLKAKISYYQMARSIGITYEECVRLIKSMKSVVSYSRGGKITLLDVEELEAIAAGIKLPPQPPNFGGSKI